MRLLALIRVGQNELIDTVRATMLEGRNGHRRRVRDIMIRAHR